ncbi:MAG: DegV family protein [Candidatus Izemoplasmatales bacterium]|jgi:DegV family protein with EDD domain|nr:DegV family protein [Candidatus Izemoplasmatales bacterium]
MSKIGIAVCGNSGIDYAMHDKKIRVFRSLLFMRGKEYEDFIDIAADDFYDEIVKYPDIDIHTAQTSTGDILKMYQDMQAVGYTELIIITISQFLSGTYQNAVLAAKMIDNIIIHVFDSHTVSYVEAKMAHVAQKMADEDKTSEAILSTLEKIRDNNHIYVTVDTLKYLVKNGRLSGAAGFFGMMLKLKPLLEVNKEGKVITIDKIRTTQRARAEMTDKFIKEIAGKDVEIFIIYTNNYDEMLELKKELMERSGRTDVRMVPLTPVVGCHAGPGTMGLGYVINV